MSFYIEKPRTTCALGGALAAISALSEVVPIAHTAAGCPGNLSGATGFSAGNCGSSYCSGASVPVSNIGENEVVFGGEKRLKEEIESAFELIEAKLFVVATGCMTEIIGDDIQRVIVEFQDENKPIIHINTASFEGDAYEGYEILLDGIFNQYIPIKKEKDNKVVNVFGVVPLFDPFFRGELEEIKRLLESIGLKVNTFFTPDQSFENIISASEAGLNIILSKVHGIKFAEKFKEKHGTPYYVTELPIGAEATDEFLRLIAKELSLNKEIVEQVIEHENLIYYRYLERLADTIADGEFKFYASVVSNANCAIPYAAFLQKELGWIICETIITDILDKNGKEELGVSFKNKDILGKLIFETDAGGIVKIITRNHPQHQGEFFFDSYTPLYILGSTLEKEFADKKKANKLSVSYPVYDRVIIDKGYAGYRGGLHLFEDIIGSLVAGR
ncbi:MULTISPECIES: nitrogenase component 1 [unclassified Clostridium]|uniref:nitrogenase component 1 n=1 Tax=unclassified Clostridium TaxID=2614128 RepID=UPI000297D186|nr:MULTISPECIES: nitrogenase component 1 [unclassified Clostridium]EKQ55513.1 MAG: nitrogenase molybdenum-iron protein, alpha and beta chain [Clostridium sp. Maddingley MBC34-26]